MLALLLGLQVETSKTAQVFAAHSLVHCGASSDALPIVVGHIGPPVRLLLHVAQDHVFNGRWQPWHLPGDIGLPAQATK